MSSASRAENPQVTEPVSTTPEVAETATQARARTPLAATYRSLLLFYLPLGFSGLMMTLDLPVVNAFINRFPDANVQVAALRVAFSLALVYEASHISMIDISTTLSSDLHVFRMLRRFYLVMAGVLLVVASLIVFTPLYDLIVVDFMNIPTKVAEAARLASVVYLLWPIPIGWRRLHQGALIKHGHPKPVGAGGLVRLGSLAVALLFFGWLGTSVVTIEPAAIAVLAMLVSVTAEAVAVHGWTARVLRTMPETTPGKPAPTYRALWHFFFPLSGTAIMSTLTNPVLTAGIASAAVAWASPDGSVVAVAAYAVAWSMAFLVFGPTLSMTQASIAWNSSADPVVRERGPRVLVGVGVVLALLMTVVALTPLAHWIFSTLLSAPEQTAAIAATVAIFLIPMPVFQSTSYMLRGKLIARHEPRAVRRAQLIDLVALVVVVVLTTASFSPLVGLLRGVPAAPAAAVAYNLILCVDIGVLLLSLRGRR